jgi:hypothetical protein
MPGERQLDALLRAISPALHADEFVYCTHSEIAGEPVCAFREAEGWTLVLRRADAERLGLPFLYPCRMITLTVHSSLDAVGLLATVATALAARGIAVNVISAYYHDHLFVPLDRVEEAMEAIRQLAIRS